MGGTNRLVGNGVLFVQVVQGLWVYVIGSVVFVTPLGHICEATASVSFELT